MRGHELGILALDRLVMVGIDDPGWRFDVTQLCLGEIRLGRPHLGNLVEEAVVFGRSRREPLILLFGSGDIGVEDRALVNVRDPGGIRVGPFSYILVALG